MGFDWLPAKNYKRHYICLNCQKGFKRASKKDMVNPVDEDLSNLMEIYYDTNSQTDIVKYINKAQKPLQVSCPECKNVMKQVHYNFEVPSLRDHASWKQLRATLQTSINYESYVQWHHLQLQKTKATTSQYKLLSQNLEKLKKS